MKKTNLLTGLLLIVFTFLLQSDIIAQARGKSAEKAEMRSEKAAQKLGEKLGLDEAQITKLKEINLKYGAQLAELEKSDREAFKSLGQKRDAEIKEIFTAEQYAKYEKGKEKMKEKMKDKRKEGGPGRKKEGDTK